LYILLGSKSFFLPTKCSWITKEKLWPAIARMTHVKKTSTQKLIEDIHQKICKDFASEVIIQNTNERSIDMAYTLWSSLGANERQTCEESNRVNIESYNRLMESLNSLLHDVTLQVLFIYI
jgi:macrodomain Ter protein organizer (MatP/YcbG family)